MGLIYPIYSCTHMDTYTFRCVKMLAMSEIHQKTNTTTTRDRASYSKPSLTRFGTVGVLTQGGSEGMNEMGMGMGMGGMGGMGMGGMAAMGRA